MNKIYKVIWSKVKHQYVVTSEFAHSCTKSTTSRAGKSVVAALAAFVLTAGMGFSVQAVDPLDGDLNANKHNINAVNELHAMTVTATNGFVTSGVVQGNNIQGTTGNIGGVSFTGSKVTAAGGGTIGGVTIENGALSANGKTLDIEEAASAAENAEKALAAAEANTETLGKYEEAGIVPGTVHPLYNGDPSTGAIAIGEGSEVLGNQTTAIGAGSTVTGGYGTAVGNSSTVTGVWGTALGASSTAAAGWATAIGGASNAAEKATAVGYHAFATANGSVALGEESTATGVDSIAHGRGASASGDNAVAIGAESTAAADNSIAIGKGAKVEANQGGNADNSIAIGGLVTGNHSVALGSGAEAKNSNTTAIGDDSHATNVHSSAFGQQSKATAKGATALGHNALARAKDSVALGAGSIADEADTISVGRAANTSSSPLQRRITNVKAGENDFDAVNVKQLNTKTAGMVQWDSVLDEDGKPKYIDSIHGVGLQEGGKITGTSLVTNSTIGSVKIENGAVTTTGNAQSSIGGVKFQSGEVTAEKATVNTLLQVGASSNPNETTRIQGGTIHTGSVIGLTNTEWTGTTNNESRAATEGQLADLSETVAANAKGVVKWDDGTNDTIHGVQLAGDGAISAASDRFSVDRYGNIAAQTYGGEGDNTNYYFNMNHADGISMGYSNGASINVEPNGVHFKVGEQETFINGNTMVTGRVNADTVQADAMYVGTQKPGNAVVTQDQLTGGISTATQGVVKWDPELDENGKPIEGKYTDSIHGVGLQEGGKITGTSLVTNSTIGSVKIENGAVTTTGNAQSSIGGVKFQSGEVTAEKSGHSG